MYDFNNEKSNQVEYKKIFEGAVTDKKGSNANNRSHHFIHHTNSQ